jgi:hypothetical protein
MAKESTSAYVVSNTQDVGHCPKPRNEISKNEANSSFFISKHKVDY